MNKNPNFRLGWSSKMPCPSWSLPASACKTGSKLAKKPGTVCSACYALKGRMRFPSVQKSYQANLDAYNLLGSEQWVEEASKAVEPYKWFRWFASGDIQLPQMLVDINHVALATPETWHWVPTREYTYVQHAHHKLRFQWAPNLTVRLSHHTIDPKRFIRGKGGVLNFSSVVTKDANCPSQHQHGQCLDCRKCWDKKEHHITYALH